MPEITHQKAQALLQAAADGPLGPDEKSALDAHLAKCKVCRDYAASLTNLEASLRRVTHVQWDNQQPSLNLSAIIHPPLTKYLSENSAQSQRPRWRDASLSIFRIGSKFTWNNLLDHTHAMGKVTIVATLLLGYFLLANLFGFQLSASSRETPMMVPTPSDSSLFLASSPTPSAQLTLAGSTPKNCEAIAYIVQADDTLERIAVKYGITKEGILEYNNLTSETLFAGVELIIPLCKSTPSHTATTTITPLNGTIFPIQPE